MKPKERGHEGKCGCFGLASGRMGKRNGEASGQAKVEVETKAKMEENEGAEAKKKKQ